jgi:Uncharacterized conserved protein (DUF2276).
MESVVWSKTPSFVFRSLIGMNLHKLTCILRNQEGCALCCLNKTCAYSYFFETHIEKNTSVLQGREKAPHPFVLNYRSVDERHGILSVTFLGVGCNYVPYVSEALIRGERFGIGRNRAQYEIESITSCGKTLNLSSSDFGGGIKHWPMDNHEMNGDFILKMETPCRIQREGNLIHEITLKDLVVSAYSRMRILEDLYGDGLDNLPMIDIDCVPVSEIIRERWVDKPYYSVRQQEVLKLGGVIGEIRANGPVDASILNYLDAMCLFNVGKNISFGLGKISMEAF